MRKHTLVFIYSAWIICLCSLSGKNVVGNVYLPPDIHELAVFSIHNVYSENFKQAEKDAEQIIKKYPSNPAGYFFYAAVLSAKMEYYQSEKYEIEFYKYCDLAIAKGEELMANDPGNFWALFFIAGSNGFKGKYESRYERWVTAFKHGWAGVDMLQDLLKKHPEMDDAIYGISAYNYWRSVKTRMLWWLPGVIDKRKESISQLLTVRQKGVYVKEACAVDLIDIFYNEKRYAEALQVAENMLSKYQNNLVCTWGKGKALLGLKEYDKAEKVFKSILTRVAADDFDSNYNSALCHYYLLEIYFREKKYESCLQEYKSLKSLSLNPLAQKRLEKSMGEADELYKKTMQEVAHTNKK